MTPNEMADACREIIGWDGDTVIVVEKTERVASCYSPIPPDVLASFPLMVDRCTVPESITWKICVKLEGTKKDVTLCKEISGHDTSKLLDELREKKQAIQDAMIAITTKGVTT